MLAKFGAPSAGAWSEFSPWRVDLGAVRPSVLWIALISSRLGLDETGRQTDVVAMVGSPRHRVVRFRTLRDHLGLAGLARKLVSQPDAICAGNWMTDADDKVGPTVRVIVKLRPDEYDELFRHVHRIGSTMSAFLRESAARAIKEERAISLYPGLSPEIPTAPD
jgi:hypothetical protein